MSYNRVIPRDLFNEASLLKCIGKLVLDIEEGKLPWLSYEHDGEAFDIEQNIGTGGIFVRNVTFTANNKELWLERPLNSRAAWPLYLDTKQDAFAVFDESGNVVLKQTDCEQE